jgi:hypothetical protein
MLNCTDLEDFERQVVDVFHPKFFLPNFTFRPLPSYYDTVNLLKEALPKLDGPLILYLEDANKFSTFTTKEWTGSFGKLVSVVNNGGGVVVGNSSDVLAYRTFQGLAHTGIRTKALFLPPLAQDDPELLEYARNGARLFQDPSSKTAAEGERPDVTDAIATWGGNAKMLGDVAAGSIGRAESEVQTRLGQSLKDVEPIYPRHRTALVTNLVRKSETRVLQLRRELLETLAEKKVVPVAELTKDMKKLLIAEQLMANDICTLRTEINEDGGVGGDVIEPYHPCVLTAMHEKMDSSSKN